MNNSSLHNGRNVVSVLDDVLTAASEVFGTSVTPTDNFFALGGDSVAAVELAVLLEEATTSDVDFALVVETPDLAALAAALTVQQAGARR